jgi:hypothetical protein
MHHSKFFKTILIVVVVLVFIGVGVWIGLAMGSRSSLANGTSLSPYSAVYLSTGDIYFGKLDWFPSPHLEDAWYLQRSTDSSGNAAVNIYPFNKVIWGPSNVVYFNNQQIIFWTPLTASSSVVQIMENPSLISSPTPPTAVEPQPAPQVPTSTSSTPPAAHTK